MINYKRKDIPRFGKFVNVKYTEDELIDYTVCWPWKGCTDKNNYGIFRLNGKNIKSHRFSYYCTFGEFDLNLCVLHKCDNPICCNPYHLYLGNTNDNNQDKIQKNRCNSPSGTNHWSCKVSDETVNQILWELYSTSKSLNTVSIGYDVDIDYIKVILHNKSNRKNIEINEHQFEQTRRKHLNIKNDKYIYDEIIEKILDKQYNFKKEIIKDYDINHVTLTMLLNGNFVPEDIKSTPEDIQKAKTLLVDSRSKLTRDQIYNIKYNEKNKSVSYLGRKYGVHHMIIRNILVGNTYKHV